jgi:hypothetical protein
MGLTTAFTLIALAGRGSRRDPRRGTGLADLYCARSQHTLLLTAAFHDLAAVRVTSRARLSALLAGMAKDVHP